ncbi:hypothetical protein EJB05_33702, partial [Eragrostis curvula]
MRFNTGRAIELPRVELVDMEEDDDDDLVPAEGSPSAVTVEDTGALDCGMDLLPPAEGPHLPGAPFTNTPYACCTAGHVLCCECNDKLKASGKRKCHVCRVAIDGDHRCHAMEHLVESIRAPCPNAVHGCAARPAYYDRRGHRRTCPYAPYRCPYNNASSCGFVGAAGALVDHLHRDHFHEAAVKHFWSQKFRNAMAILQLEDIVAAITFTDKEEEKEEEEEEAGLEPGHIEIVMLHGSVLRAVAVRALKGPGGDIFAALMELVNCSAYTP